MSTPHSFQVQLAYSERASHETFWNDVYRKAFPNLIAQVPCPGDFASQRQGIDRVLVLSNGRLLKIDEKKRERVYPDILLEFLSNDRTGAPGWMEKDLVIDYLSYAFMPNRKVYMFDWLFLRRAWLHYRDEWKQRYRTVKALNSGYMTHSVAVPIPVLQTAVRTASIIELPIALLPARVPVHVPETKAA